MGISTDQTLETRQKLQKLIIAYEQLSEKKSAILYDSTGNNKGKKDMDDPLTHPGRLLLSLDGRRAITRRASTKGFRKKEASEFIEFLYATGTEYGAKFSEKTPEYANFEAQK